MGQWVSECHRLSLSLQSNDMIVFLSKELHASILNTFKTESKCKLCFQLLKIISLEITSKMRNYSVANASSLTCLRYMREKEMATHSSVLAWRIPGMGEPGGPPSMGSHRVEHD